MRPVNHRGLYYGKEKTIQSTTHSAHIVSNQKSSKIYKISPDTNVYKQYLHTQTLHFFSDISPLGIAPVTKAHEARTR